MDLIFIKLNNFKGFSKSSTLSTRGKLVALLGENEAGKSSIIRALSILGGDKNFERSDKSRNNDDSIPTLEAAFSLSEEDLRLSGLKKGTVLHIEKSHGTKYWFAPSPSRDMGLREEVLKKLDKLKDLTSLNSFIEQNKLLYSEYQQALNSGISVLRSTEQQLSDNSIKDLKRLYSLFEVFSVEHPLMPSTDSNQASADRAIAEAEITLTDEFLESLAELVSFEKQLNLEDYAIKALISRVPRILEFTEADRNLQSQYELIEAGPSIPDALRNLAGVCNLDLTKLIHVRSDPPLASQIIERANHALKSLFKKSWSQSGLSVRFSLDGTTLRIFVVTDDYEFSSLNERSDGLRQYVALLAFITLSRVEKSDPKPILLVDEAETHLHYDAQADLIQMFARQDVAQKIIYTTHSAGCLPEDLGTGIRLVYKSNNQSCIRNKFWENGNGGITPLLFGLGASTFAFFPVRRTVLVEGVADMLLLPTLFREACEREHLGFQIVPGLSSAAANEISRLPYAAGTHVAYFVDSDAGGKQIRQRLLDTDVPADLVFCIDDKFEKNIQVEDLISADALARSIDKLVSDYFHKDIPIDPTQFPSTSRWNYITKWLKDHSLPLLSKADVAMAVLERAEHDEHILDAYYADHLRKLHGKIIKKINSK